ncbi:MAG: ferritin-like domain-containing protein [Gemmatimonadota bacterium]
MNSTTMTDKTNRTDKTLIETLDPELTRDLTEEARPSDDESGRFAARLAMLSVPLALAATARRAFAQEIPQNVIDVLNFALTLEYLENDFYIAGLAADPLIPMTDRSIFQTIQMHEQVHVDFLETTLGAQATAKPTFDFTAGGSFDPFNDYPTFRLLAQAFEDTGVRAYKGQAPALIDNDMFLSAALTIHSVEGRHAARVRRLNGLQGWIPGAQPGAADAVAPVYAGEDTVVQLGINIMTTAGVSSDSATEAFDEPLTMEQVNAIAGQFIA